jgi:ribosomal protein S8E
MVSLASSKQDVCGHVYAGILTTSHCVVSELGLVTTGGKVVWGKYAQVTNNPENDGCINAVLLV